MSRILVVDDEWKNRELLDAILSQEGYEVMEASDGPSALQILSERKIDVVLLDVLMPKMGGVEVCRRIREDLKMPALPIIFVTAHGDREARIRGKAAGGDDFLTKPVDDVELKVRVKSLLTVKAYHDLRHRQREAIESELEKTRDDLIRMERLASLGTLAAGVGHELNNIAAVFRSLMGPLREAVHEGTPPAPEDVDELGRVCEHVVTHGRQLLSLGSPAPDATQEVDLREVLRTTVQMLHTSGRIKYVEIVSELPSSAVWLRLNRTRLEQVLVNLLSNAADALESTADRPKQIRLSLGHDEASGATEIQIADTGSGIAPASLEKIFEPYFTTKPPGRGTGLGLPVVKRIIESLGGRISVTSELNVGTTFTLELPGTLTVTRSIIAPP